MEYEIRLLEPRDGFCPFERWFLSLRDNEAVARVIARLRRVRAGNFGDVRSVGSGVNELRIDYGPGYRVYYAISGTSIVVLIQGGNKQTQQDDIALAQKLWQENKDEFERFQRVFGP